MHRVRISFLAVGIAAAAVGCDSRTVPAPASSATADATPPGPALKKRSKPPKRVVDPTKLAPLNSKSFQPDI